MELVPNSRTIIERTGKERSDRDNHSFSTYLENIKPMVDTRILDHFRDGGAETPIDHRLEITLKHGKRMRAGLLMLIFETFGHERGREMALDLAATVEIAHAASLIVDDMLDEDETRHDMPALHVTAGHKKAFLGTIGLLSYPYQIASMYGREFVLGVARTHRAMVRGATMELNGVPSFGIGESYESIIGNKTGSLFGLAARYGAMAAGFTSGTTDLCSGFGTLTGKAMQVADDVADLESLMNGKAIGIGGSEVLLLRRCIDQTGHRQEDDDRDIGEPIYPFGTARRKDIEIVLNGYLEAAIRDAVESAEKLETALSKEGKERTTDRRVPELRHVPLQVAKMALGERNEPGSSARE